MSCNGCRVLRKGCSENCSIKPCLQWIKTPESQGNATVFLAKFYGRAGLMNLINAGPEHLRPGIFRSLLYEACGRIVNPIYGSVGLLWSGNWQLCQNAVEAVLKGSPITQITSDAAETHNGPPLKPYDIRHVIKNENTAAAAASNDLHRVRVRPKFKRSAAKAGRVRQVSVDSGDDDRDTNFCRSTSHDSSLSHQSEAVAPSRDVVSQLAVEETEMVTETHNDKLEVVERLNNKDSSSSSSSSSSDKKIIDDGEIELELTLGFEPLSRTTTTHHITSKPKGIKRSRLMTVESAADDNDNDYQDCRIELGLDYSARRV